MALPVIQNTHHEAAAGEPDQRPRFAMGHVMLPATNVSQLRDFYTELGMRLIADMGRTVILELRGGTHIVVHTGPPGDTSLDLIVDDIDDTWSAVTEAGGDPSPIERGHPHDRFVAQDPEGNTLVINSNHAMGPV